MVPRAKVRRTWEIGAGLSGTSNSELTLRFGCALVQGGYIIGSQLARSQARPPTADC